MQHHATLSLASALVLLLGSSCTAPARVGPEVQVYPAGVQATVAGQWTLNETDVATARAGWNETDRGDFGEHEDERGGGPGLGFGWRRYFAGQGDGWMVGGELDLWWLSIDWEDPLRAPGGARGNTDVLVVQPAALGGYRWRLGESGWVLDLTASLGVEVNASTAGEDVGQGLIGLVGFSLLRSY